MGAELFVKGDELRWLDSTEIRDNPDDDNAHATLRWNLVAAFPGGFEHRILLELYAADPARCLWYWIDDGDKFPLALDLESWWRNMLRFGGYTGWERVFVDLERLEALRSLGSGYGRRKQQLRTLEEVVDALAGHFGEAAVSDLRELTEEYAILS